jgi:2-polyprenyl-3-methyl-5-hydroxy-6-metoxy-1,4-benzoquinol methylase
MAGYLGNYYTQKRHEMLNFIPLSCNRVLDVGCATGEFACALKRERHVEVWGIEINKEAAEKASKKLDKVLLGDIEQDHFDLPEKYFDCIVFNDVLEHLRDPWAVLQKAHSFLMKDGYIIASIPNVRYFENIKKLIMHKEWKYTDEGILDRNHLRFFTIKSVRELFESSGYFVETITGIRSRQFPWKFRMLNYIFNGAFDDMRYPQYASVARRR